MESLFSEIRDLIARLDQTVHCQDSVEWKTRYYLNRILAGSKHATSPDMLTPAVINLRRFWMESVEWCSQLSRDVEKIITHHMELVAPNPEPKPEPQSDPGTEPGQKSN